MDLSVVPDGEATAVDDVPLVLDGEGEEEGLPREEALRGGEARAMTVAGGDPTVGAGAGVPSLAGIGSY